MTHPEPRHCLDCKHFVIREGNTKTRYLCQKRSYLDMAWEPAIHVLPEVSPLDQACGLYRSYGEPELPTFAKGASNA